MKTKLEKKEFISELKNVLKVRAQLLTMREIVLDVARKFDGKVYNKRFDNAALEELKKVNGLVRIETRFKNPSSEWNGHEFPVVEVGIIIRTDKYDYNKYESLYLHLALVDNRINMSVTEIDTMSKRWLENFNKGTKERKEVIKKYDKFMKQAEKLNAMVRDFNELPHVFRQNILNSYGFTIYVG